MIEEKIPQDPLRPGGKYQAVYVTMCMCNCRGTVRKEIYGDRSKMLNELQAE